MIDFLILTLVLVAIYAIAGYMFNIHFGYTGLINLGIAGFFALGAYATGILTTPHKETYFAGETYSVGFGLPIWVGIIAAILISAFVALIIGIIALRSIKGEHLAIMTLGFSEIIRFVVINEEWLTRGPMGIMDIPRPLQQTLHGLPYLLLLIGFLVLIYFISSRIRVSSLGRVLRGIREDEIVLDALGKDVFYFRVLSLVLGAALGGLAGALWAHFTGAIQPQDFTPTLTFIIASSVIIGGEGNNKGVLIGSLLVVGFLYQAPRFLPMIGNPWTIPAARFILIGLLIILVLKWKPAGILPKKLVQIKEE